MRAQILAPVVRGRKGEYHKLLEDARKSGFVRVIVDGILYDLGEPIPMDKNKKHNIDVVVDRIVIREESRSRIGRLGRDGLKTRGRAGSARHCGRRTHPLFPKVRLSGPRRNH